VERGAPRGVRAFGRDGETLLCAQPTPFGDRFGRYTGLGYGGPYPLESLVSEACWNIAERRRREDEDFDGVCEAMSGYAARVLG
jgi:hypothetical protein